MEKTSGARKIIQIAHVVKDIEKSMMKYHEILDIGPWSVYTFAPPALRECTFMGKSSDATWVLSLAWVGDIQFELMQPLSGESVYTHFLDKKGEGIHHIKEWVDDCAAAIEEYRKKGIEVIQSGKYDEDEFYYLNTEPQLGILYELGNCGEIRSPERMVP
jgi:4-hydroxyphenylpyruvate dioxygenase-like putative hemolysin